MLWLLLSSFLLLMITGLLYYEWKEWKRYRNSAMQRKAAQKRLVRRTIGSIALLAVIILLRYPGFGTLGPNLALLKIITCLFLCLFLVILALWDARAVLQGIHADSVQDLRNLLREIQEDGINRLPVSSANSSKSPKEHEDP